MDRRLDELDIVAIVIDGKSFKDDQMIIALGVTEESRKVILVLSRQAQRMALCARIFSPTSLTEAST